MVKKITSEIISSQVQYINIKVSLNYFRKIFVAKLTNFSFCLKYSISFLFFFLKLFLYWKVEFRKWHVSMRQKKWRSHQIFFKHTSDNDILVYTYQHHSIKKILITFKFQITTFHNFREGFLYLSIFSVFIFNKNWNIVLFKTFQAKSWL